MTKVIDIHTHNLDATQAVISVEPQQFDPRPGLFYCVGHHPWSAPPASIDTLATAILHPQVVAVGETGLDALRGAPLPQQIALLEQHIALAQEAHKPIIAHMVRTSRQLIDTWRRMAPQGISLVVHGMRGNANVVRTLVDIGFYLSYGEHFNPDALRATPLDRLLAETDDSTTPIASIIAAMAQTLGIESDLLTSIIATNASRVLGKELL